MRTPLIRLAIAIDGTPTTLAWTGIEVVAERQSVRLLFRASGARPASVRVTNPRPSA